MIVVRTNGGPPTTGPAGAAAPPPFPDADTCTFVGRESVSIRAGTFEARHYRSTGRDWEVVDFWIGDRAGPLGLVRLEARSQRRKWMNWFERELIATGRDAVHEIPDVFPAVRPAAGPHHPLNQQPIRDAGSDGA